MDKKNQETGIAKEMAGALFFSFPPPSFLLSCVENIELVLCSCHEPHEFLYITKVLHRI